VIFGMIFTKPQEARCCKTVLSKRW